MSPEGIGQQKTILVIEDLSLMGRCSSMTAVPVLSCAGISCTLMPTALLSSHTGGFDNVYFRDLTDEMREILKRWSALQLRFDAIYVGYLAGGHQVDVVMDVLDRFLEPQTLLFVDPVMGDEGRRYAFLSDSLQQGFRKLCTEAHLIFPNPTEAAFLLGVPPQEGPIASADSGRVLRGLRGLGAQGIVLTSVSDGAGRLGVAALDAMMDEEEFHLKRERPGRYPGTGDLLASAVIASVLRGCSLSRACSIAVDFLSESLDEVERLRGSRRFGLPFESRLQWLAARLNASSEEA